MNKNDDDDALQPAVNRQSFVINPAAVGARSSTLYQSPFVPLGVSVQSDEPQTVPCVVDHSHSKVQI